MYESKDTCVNAFECTLNAEAEGAWSCATLFIAYFFTCDILLITSYRKTPNQKDLTIKT